MKKRVLSALLVLCLACSLVSTAWAAAGRATPESAAPETQSAAAPAPTDEHPDIAEGIENGTWGGAPTPKPTATLPQTSDDLPLTALVVVLAVAAAAIVALVVVKKRRDKDQK